ncbi:PKTS1 [Diplonema papillatum]|nr:PKTS1 [Diplonema papillatum]
MTTLPSAWFRVVVGRDNASRRLFCFAHSGAGPQVFHSWRDLLDPHTELVAINLPGRNDRTSEANVTDLQLLVAQVMNALFSSGALALPFAFFGHSFGALVAFETAMKLAERSAPTPMHIFVSAVEAPSSLAKRDTPEGDKMVHLSDDAFLSGLLKWGVLPKEIEGDELRAAVLPALRADIQMFEDYVGSTEKLTANTTMSVIGGETDGSVSHEGLAAWKSHGNVTDVLFLEGGHFYFDSDSSFEKLLAHVNAKISERFALLPLAVGTGGDAEYLHETRTTWELIRDQAKKTPNAVAVVDNVRGEITYSDVWKFALKIAKQICRLTDGRRGVTVGMMLPHSADYVSTMLGIWAAGGCFLVLERAHPPEMLQIICQTCNPDGSGRPDIIITKSEFVSSFQGKLADVPKLMLDDKWEDLYDYAGYAPEPGCLTDRAILMTTSGTSGIPKLIEGSHKFQQLGMLSRTLMMPYTNDRDREACSVMFVWEAPRSLVQGHVCVVIPETVIIDPVSLVSYLIKQRATRILTTPSLAATVYTHLELSPKVSAQLQETMTHWFFMGEVCTAKLIQQALMIVPKVKVVNAYSTWEAADTTMFEGSLEHLRPYSKFYPVGHLHEGVNAVVLDPETREPVPCNVPGELYTTGPHLSNGYAMAPELTAERFIKLPKLAVNENVVATLAEKNVVLDGSEKWYKSGDMAVMLADGAIELHGRIDSTIKIRGFKVGLPFVEGVLADIPYVELVIVVPTFDPESNQPDAIAALLKQSSDCPLSFEDLVKLIKNDIQTKMPRVAIPTFFLRLTDVVDGDLRQGGEAKKINRRAIPKLFTKELKERFGIKRQGAARDMTQLSAVDAAVSKVWAEVLEIDEKTLDEEENFFELGGHSLLASTLTQKLSAVTSVPVSVLDLYENSTLKALITFIIRLANPMESRSLLVVKKPRSVSYPHIAIVGMAGKFPGAANIYEYWDNLKNGRVTPTFHTDEFLANMGVAPEVIAHPDFVKVAYKVDDVDKFDAKFWGIGRTEAMTMDPQHRVFIETAWNAVENAGYAPKSGFERDERVGVFASSGIDGYLIHHLQGGALLKPLEPGNLFMTEVASEKDYIATRVSYLMNLRGPSMNVNSACSSALVAVAQACASIAVGESDMAIAGGCSINFPNTGFLYQDGLIYSKDGYVRPLDETAAGTAFGDAVGAIVLKKLDRAVEDGDNIWGVIRGFGVSNDGSVKVGYSAPAAAGQADCIKKAMAMSELTPQDVSYVEMHATGTLVGDGIEAKGLATAWKESAHIAGDEEKWCAVGSVKGNIAHANCAAGITGLIKTALMLKNHQLVPTANFNKLNEKVVFEGTPFYVNDKTQEWTSKTGMLAAGVSSFGIGGTNAHVLMSDYAEPPVHAKAEGPATLLFSAKSKDSLGATMLDLATFLRKGYLQPSASLADVAHTLRTGRELYPIRHSVAVNSADSMDAVADLVAEAAAACDGKPAAKKPVVAFFCPGQGSQYLDMAHGLMRLPTFKIHFDECAEQLKPLIKQDIRDFVFGTDRDAFSKPVVLQPSLFAVEYAVSRLLMSIGVVPAVIAGHSIGEYVAAVLGGHITLACALNIIAVRAVGTTNDVPEGAMLSVSVPEKDALAAIERSAQADSLWLAAANSPMHSVISGSIEAVDALKAELAAFDPKIKAAKLHVNRPFHSALMRSAASQLLTLSYEGSDQVKIPTTSNVTGKWLTESVCTGEYWKDHMEKTVKWRQCAETLYAEYSPTVCIEVGPGNTLSNLGSRCWTPELVGEKGTEKRPAFEQTMRHATATSLRDVDVFASLLGRLWAKGVKVDWQAWDAELGSIPSKRVALPGYSFEKTSFWVNPQASIYVESTDAPVRAVAVAAVQPVDTDMLIRFAKEAPKSPSLRMYCLPFAGGSSRAFEKWSSILHADIDVVAVELPGRGGRAGESHVTSDLSDEGELKKLAAAIEADSKGLPFILVGKSMGGLMAVEIARLLKHLAPKQLIGLAIAGRAPVRPLSAIPDLDMNDETLNRYSLAPDSLKESDAWKTYLLPMLKADLQCDTRNEKRLSQAAEPFLAEGVKLAVFCGTNDDVCPWGDAEGWKTAVARESDATVHFMPGGHEFLNEHSHRIAQQVAMLATAWLVKVKADELQTATELSKTAVKPTLTQPAPMYALQWEDDSTPAAPLASEPVVLDAAELRDRPWDARVLTAFEAGSLVLSFPAASLAEGEAACWAFLSFVQRFPDVGKKGTVVLLLAGGAAAGLVAGASKAVPFEIPEILVVRAYVAAGSALPAAAARAVALAALLRGKACDIDMRGPVARRPRIVKEKVAVPPRCPPNTPAGTAAILVTGWTGGLGGELLKYLVTKMGIAPANLVLLARRQTESPFPGAAEVVVVQNMADLRGNAVLKTLFTSKFAVLHLAGALDDAMISNQSAERLRHALAPKVDLFENIVDSAKALGGEIVWTVAFSSTSSLFGYPGQSNYCAANGFLDAFASFEPPATVKKMVAISWGPWGEVGMAKKGSKAYELAVKEGDTPLATLAAMTCLGHVLTLLFNDLPTRGQYAVCDVDWVRSPWSELPMVAPLVEKKPVPAALEVKEAAGSAGDLAARVKEWLTKEVGRTSWEQVADEDMAALGLDSLDTVQLRNAYNKQFQATAPLALFSKPNLTLRTLVKSLL